MQTLMEWLVDSLRDVLDWARRLIDWAMRLLGLMDDDPPAQPPGPAPQPAPPPCVQYGNYQDPPWRWDGTKCRWVYRPSDPLEHESVKGYNCSEYVIARIEGRAPRWGGNQATTTETEEVEAKLVELGWVARPGGCNCGCGEGQNKNCVVVYKDRHDDGSETVVHVAIFDHVRCDWGGKLTAGFPIARYKRPEDYYEGRVVPPNSRMIMYCPKRADEPGGPGTVPPVGGQKTDEWLHDEATPQ